jgi:hypothetical protein
VAFEPTLARRIGSKVVVACRISSPGLPIPEIASLRVAARLQIPSATIALIATFFHISRFLVLWVIGRLSKIVEAAPVAYCDGRLINAVAAFET